MSHQINYYILPSETGAIEAGLKTIAPMVILHHRSPHARPNVASSFSAGAVNPPTLYYFLLLEADLALVRMLEVPAQGYWVVDSLRSPVIELSVCYFNGALIRRGRVYYNTTWYDDNDMKVVKSDAFQHWSKRIFARLRKALTRKGSFYFGPQALAWLQASDQHRADPL
jgi:hypothetical protein